MAGEKDGLSLILGTRKGLFVLEQTDGKWKTVTCAHVGIPVPYAVRDSRDDVLWASLDHGHWGQKLQRSTDLGVTWQEVEAPKYPDGAQIKEGQPATMRYLWVIQPGAADEADRMYIGTEPGGLFVSNDGGNSFQLVEPLWNHPSREEHWFGGGRDHAGIHSVVIDPRDRRRIFVGVSCAGVFETADGGETWVPRNKGLRADFLPNPHAEVGHDPHLLVQCPAQPDVFWQQNHCGIFRSADACRSWQEVTQNGGPARFGFAIAVDVRNPNVAWVVPAISDECRVAVDGALCVCRTDDGGKTWTAFRKGLPQEGCYDVVFRHALDVRENLVAFGSTTGNVFLSENRGESWISLGRHFPPVYSVRFADGRAV